jgi:shikimate kinase
MNLYLVGYRGTGKSTVARLAAEALGWPWVDADALLEERAAASIAEIFARRGEEGFRALERDVVAELAAGQGRVVALGGGAVLAEANRRAIAGSGRTVWLRAGPATILARISADPASLQRRPRLTTSGGLAEIEQLLSLREPLYRQSADLSVDTEDKTPEEVAREVVAYVRGVESGK